MRSRILILGLALFFPASVLPAQQPAVSADAESIIVVAGHASVSIPPDAVTVQFLVSSVEPKQGDATAATDSKADSVARMVKALGIAELKVSRIRYGAGPVWDYTGDGERTFQGYGAHVTILVMTRSLDETGRIVDVGLLTGARELSGIQYSSSRMGETRRDALRAAVNTARLDATAMAEAAGGTLGRLLLLTTESSGPVPGTRTRGFGGQSDTQITPEDITVNARVESHWLFLDGSASE